MITIENYNSDVGYATFYGWDMKFALEEKDFYSFEFQHRQDKNRVYVLLHRNAQPQDKLIGDFYEVYIADMKDMWKRTVHLAPTHLNKSNFYNWVESIIDEEYGLPF